MGFLGYDAQSLNINPKTPKPKYKFKLLAPPGRPESLYLEAFGHPGGPENLNLGFWGPLWDQNLQILDFWFPGGPESLNINLYLSFLVFWRARKPKFKSLGPPGVARKLKFKLLGPPGGQKPSNLRFLAFPVAPQRKYKFGFIFRLCGLGERFGLAQQLCHRSCLLGLSISAIKICSPWQFF